MVGHGLEIAGDTAVGLGELGLAEATGDLLLALVHAQIAFGTVVGEGNVGVLGEEQYGGLMFLQTLPQGMGIGLGDPAPFAIVLFREGRQLPLGACDAAIIAEVARSMPSRSKSGASAPTPVESMSIGKSPSFRRICASNVPARARNRFHPGALNPYLNFHSPCCFAVDQIDAKGKIRKACLREQIRTHWGAAQIHLKLSGLPQAWHRFRISRIRSLRPER